MGECQGRRTRAGSIEGDGIETRKKKKLEKRKAFILCDIMPLETLAIIETTLLRIRWGREREFLLG